MSASKDYAHRHPDRAVGDDWEPPHWETYDARRELKLALAIDWLGPWWRGKHRCSHRYTRADGVKVRMKRSAS
jgi:hypothetical protein